MGSFIGGVSGMFAIIMSWRIFCYQQQLNYQIGLNADFFEMLKTLKNISDSYKENIIECKSAILKHFIQVNKANYYTRAESLLAYNFYFTRHILCHSEIMHFLQYFKQTFDKIEYDHEIKEKKRYMETLSAQLTPEELFIIFFACIAENGVWHGVDFSKYHFFKYLKTDNQFLDKVKHQKFPQKTFIYNFQKAKVDDLDWGEENYDDEQLYVTIDRLKNEN